jgi:maltooligosyltrehalose synthase
MRNLKEARTLKEIEDYCDDHEIVYVRHHPVKPAGAKGKIVFCKTRKNQKGAADILMPQMAVEVKAPKEDQRQDQVEWQDRCERAGGRYFVVRSLSEFIDLLDVK